MTIDTHSSTRALDLPVSVTAELLTRGLLTRPPARLELLGGPLIERWALSDNSGHHLWVDLPVAGPVELSTPPEWALSADAHGCVLATPSTRLSGGGAVTVLPGPVTLGAAWTPAAGRDLAAAAELVGRSLRELHAVPPTGCGIDRARTTAPFLRRLATPAAPGSLLARPEWEDVARRVLTRASGARASGGRAEDRVVPLHGQPATGHLLLPRGAATGGDRRAVLLLGWSGPRFGPAWVDVGHLLGDLVELALLHSAPGAARVLSRSLRRGYDGPGPLGGEFWRVGLATAALKVLEHEQRLLRSHPPAATRAVQPLLDSIAGALLNAGTSGDVL